MTTSDVFCLENNCSDIILVCEQIKTISLNFAIANNFYIPCLFYSRAKLSRVENSVAHCYK